MKKLFLILILGLVLVPAVNAQPDTTGVLKRNNYTTEKWTAAQDYVIINTTAEFLILDRYNATGASLEDLTSYTEYEESQDFITVVNSTHVIANGDLRWSRWLVYDYGEDYFNGFFNITFAFYTIGTGPNGLNDHFFIMMCNETVASRNEIRDTGDNFWGLNFLNDNSGDDYNWRVNYQDDGLLSQPGWTEDNGLYNIWIYVRILREGTSLKVLAYNNPDFTDLRFSRNMTISADTTYRYFFAVNSLDIANYANYYYQAWVKDIDFHLDRERYRDSGNWYSSDILENATVGSVAELFYGQAIIPGGTSLETFLSSDNATWTLYDEDEEIIEIIRDQGYNETLYVRFRLNSSGDYTPAVDYFHIFYEDPRLVGVLGAWENFYLENVVFVTGTPIWGNLTSLKYLDGKTMFGYEESGTPGLDVRGNFTIPVNTVSLSLRSFNRFDGNPADEIHYDAWNFETLAWDTIGASFNDDVWEWTNASMSLDGEYRDPINATHEKVYMRMHHPDAGVAAHEIETDLVYLRGFTDTAQPSINITEVIYDAVGGDWVSYSLNNVSILIGTPVWGDFSNLTYRDGLTMFGYEEGETPGMLVHGNFTIPKALISGYLAIYGEYIGSPAHEIKYQVWNYEALEWENLGDPYESGAGWMWANQSISLDGQYREDFNATHDTVFIRLIHTNQGIITHSLEVDYVALIGFVPQAKTGGLYWIILISLIILLAALLSRKRS